MKNDKKKLNTEKLKAALKEFVRKFIVSLKKNPSVIPFAMLIISFLVFSLNLTAISNTTAKIQGIGMGLCEFCSMLFSILSMICLLNAFPKRQKPNISMIVIMLTFFAIIIAADAIYCFKLYNGVYVDADKITITMKNYFIVEAQNALIVHIVLMVLTTVSVILEPLIAKLLRRVNTSVAIEENAKIEAIDISDED